jgi:hypothetical protein
MSAVFLLGADSRYTDSSGHGFEPFVDRRRADRFKAPTLLTDRQPTQAPWVDSVIERLIDLTSLQSNWDSYGASAPSMSAALALIEILAQTTSAETPVPAIVPSPHGHFQAEWHENGVDLEVEVVSPTHVDVYFAKDRVQWHDVLRSDLSPLVKALDELVA